MESSRAGTTLRTRIWTQRLLRVDNLLRHPLGDQGVNCVGTHPGQIMEQKAIVVGLALGINNRETRFATHVLSLLF